MSPGSGVTAKALGGEISFSVMGVYWIELGAGLPRCSVVVL